MRLLVLDNLRARLGPATARAPADISLPWNFQHNLHVSIDPATGEFLGLPTKWQMLLEEQGVTRVRLSEKASLAANGNGPVGGSQGARGVGGKTWTAMVKGLLGVPFGSPNSGPEEISLPWKFQHHTHVSWDQASRRYIGLPKEWAVILESTPSESSVA
ncbi:hypothetical protein OBBRIDRAFT_787316 [Obba rivulosa]|uniref:CRIB domain-containing protein n=1 Tax=Obba rivulosa TaxID=1052685 RepID=A0A8E2DV82_9APHY|nr:hypothetical protein OBBRIDRAFT_787316 [Obba rivulosa]